MDVELLSPSFTGERNLLSGIRSTLAGADEATLCVAFASMAGVHLLREELAPIAKRGGAMLLVTTVFGSTAPAALQLASDLGVKVRVMNRAGGTFHPKVYFARTGDQVRVVVGSANLTGGLITNVEMATRLSGEMREPELAMTLQWTRDLWETPSVVPWVPQGVVEEEVLEPALLLAIAELVKREPVLRTLGRAEAPNRVVEVTPRGLYVETERSSARGAPPQLVPAWMIQLAWDYLRAHGALTNKFLLDKDGLNVKRSSFVCALLARLPGVEPMSTPMGVRLVADS